MATQAKKDIKVRCIVANVHTLRGKMLDGDEKTLGAEEAEKLIASGAVEKV
jgi:hypothetical protein